MASSPSLHKCWPVYFHSTTRTSAALLTPNSDGKFVRQYLIFDGKSARRSGASFRLRRLCIKQGKPRCSQPLRFSESGKSRGFLINNRLHRLSLSTQLHLGGHCASSFAIS